MVHRSTASQPLTPTQHNVTFKDNVKLLFGTGNDAALYYDGTNLILDTAEVGSGVLVLKQNVRLDGSTSGQVTLTVGATPTTGTITIPSGTHTLATLDGTESFSNKTVVAPVLSGTITGTYTLGGTPTITSPTINSATLASPTVTTSATLGDNVTALFGAGTDLALSSDGTDIKAIVPATADVILGRTGAPSPDTLLHIWDASAGTVTALANTKLTIESDGNAFLSFLTPAANISGIVFGDAASNLVGRFEYNHVADRFTFVIGGASQLFYSAGTFAFQVATTISTSTGDLTLAPAGGLKLQNATTDTLSFFGVTAIDQEPTIADADGTLASVTTQFNTLLASLEAYGLLASA